MSNAISIGLYTDANGKQYTNVYGIISYGGKVIDNTSGISTNSSGVVSAKNMASLSGNVVMWANKAAHDANSAPLVVYQYSITGSSPYTQANLYTYVIAYLQSLTSTFTGVSQAA